jgi:P22_AR N-terminal domain
MVDPIRNDLVPVVTIDFHGDQLQAIQHDDKVWVVLRRCCESLGIDTDSQRKRLADRERSPWACTVIMTVHDATGRLQEAFLIDLDTLLMWLATIDGSRVSEEKRPKILLYQVKCAKALRDHFLGKPEKPAELAPQDKGLANIEVMERMLAGIKENHLRQMALEEEVAKLDEAVAQTARIAIAAIQTANNDHGFYTVIGWCNITRRRLDQQAAALAGKQLSKICRERGIEIRRTRHPVHGHVNLYPEEILREVIGPK